MSSIRRRDSNSTEDSEEEERSFMLHGKEMDSLEPLAHSNESVVEFSVGYMTNDIWMQDLLENLETNDVMRDCHCSQPDMISLASSNTRMSTHNKFVRKNLETDTVTQPDCNASQAMISLKSDMMSGIDSQVMDDMTYLSLDTKRNQFEVQNCDEHKHENGIQVPKKQQVIDTHRSNHLLRCVHEGSLSKVYHFNVPENKRTMEINDVAVKILSDQFPDESQLAQLDNEKKMSNLLSGKCSAVRAAIDGTLPKIEIEGCSSSRTLCLEWVPGITLREWVRAQGGRHLNGIIDDAQLKTRHESSINVAKKIAHSLSEIHEAGVVLNNISAENIIVSNSTSMHHSDELTVHIIGLGSASLRKINHNLDNSEIEKDLHSMGRVFFELFSGQSPYQSVSNRNDSFASHKKNDSCFDFSAHDNSGGNHGETACRNLRELRSTLSTSLLPSQVTAFILELMGEFELSSAAVSDNLKSNHFYSSAREVHKYLEKMIIKQEDILPSISSQEGSRDLNMLNFAPNILYGRKKHQEFLMNSFTRVILHGGEREVVLVTGFSGTGKTAFVKTTLHQPIQRVGGHFLHIKFDQLQQAEPLAAVLAAFNYYIDSIFDARNRNLSWCTNKVEEIKGIIGMDGMRILAELIPTFGKMITTTAPIQRENIGNSMSQNRLNFLFQIVVRVIVSPENPMVLFLDDLQWADDSSLHLLRALIMDSENSSVFFVESYRTNEATGSNHPLSNHISALRAGMAISEIQIDNLNNCDTNELLSDAISEPQSFTQSLSNIIYRKTGGNALLTVEFVKSLWDEGLIWFSFYKCAWEWNEKLIESKGVLGDAANFIARKILNFSEDLQLILKIMSCLGSQCEKSTICLIRHRWTGHGTADTDETSLINFGLKTAVCEGILDKVGSKYKFAHDQIQLAAYSLIPKCDQSFWHLRIGQLLISSYKNEELKTMLFLVVDQLNRGKESVSEDSRRISLAELNFQAGEKAKASGVFSSSACYFAEGMSLLGEDDWNENYDLVLRLQTACADSEFRNGAFERMTETLECIFRHGACFSDKLPAYNTLILSLFAQKKMKIGIEIGLFALENAGQPISVDADVSIVQAEMLKTNRLLDGKDIEALTGKTMEDKPTITLMEVLESLALFAHHTHYELMPLFICRMIQLTISHGVCESTTYAFAAYSAILYGMFNDVKSGNKYAKLSLGMMKRIRARHNHCRVFALLYGVVFPRTEHLPSCLDPVMNAYNECIKIGDSLYAILNASLHCTISFQAGKDLDAIAKFLARVQKKAIEYKQEAQIEVVQPTRQTILNLIGRSDNPVLMEGEAISFVEYFSKAREEQNNHISCRLYLYQMRLAYMFDHLELAVHMATKCRDYQNILLGKFECCEFKFYDGLISFVQARKTNSGSWIDLANESIMEIQKWANDAPCNCEHKLILLEAERCFYLGDHKKALEKYELATMLSRKNGFIQDHALSCERAAACHLEKGDESKASYYYGKAHDSYLEWGARSKADHMCRHSPF